MSLSAPEGVLLSCLTPDGLVVNFMVDASLSEQHGAQAIITDQPVEKRPNITDHIRPMPLRLSLEAFFSDTPTVSSLSTILGKSVSTQQTAGSAVRLASDFSGAIKCVDADQFARATGQQSLPPGMQRPLALQFDTPVNRVKETYADLVDACQSGGLFIINTTLKTYKNMAIENISAPRNAAMGNAISCTLDFKEIIEADVLTVRAPLAPQKRKKQNGHKPTKDATDQQQDQVKASLADKIAFGGK